MKLGLQLTDAPPDIDHSRDRLLARLHHFRNDEEVSRLSTDEDYALIYAYGMQHPLSSLLRVSTAY